jgi:hypothetical protein
MPLYYAFLRAAEASRWHLNPHRQPCFIELPEDVAKARSRDPRTGFVAYVPTGSVAKGEMLAKTGGAGKTMPCEICHSEGLKGMGSVPRLAAYAAAQNP